MFVMMENMELPRELRMKLREYMYESKKTVRLEKHNEILRENISDGLQLEVHHWVNDFMLQSIYWVKECSSDFRSEICRALHPHLTGPREELRRAKTLILIRSGVCASRGIILVRGDVWGHENILLQSEYLEDTTYPRTLTFVESLMLGQNILRKLIEQFPKEDKRLRRIQVRLALYRAFILICREAKKEPDGHVSDAGHSHEMRTDHSHEIRAEHSHAIRHSPEERAEMRIVRLIRRMSLQGKGFSHSFHWASERQLTRRMSELTTDETSSHEVGRASMVGKSPTAKAKAKSALHSTSTLPS
jgi:hypothetical protein